MYLKNIFVYYFIVLFLASCQKERKLSYISIQNDTVPKLEFTEKERKTWYLKDIIEDSIPGVSLEKANSDILFIKTQKRTIVALIDTEISIDHDKLKNNFWINKKEIPDNNIDDDNNGYIDDINGWNFIKPFSTMLTKSYFAP